LFGIEQLERAHRLYSEMGARGHARSVTVLMAEHHRQDLGATT
jgi:hypothetical protein